ACPPTIGGAPMMLSAGLPTFGSPFVTQPAVGYAMPSLPPARPQLVQQQAPAPRIIRGQRPEEPVRASPVRQAAIRMPSPEELGVADVKRPENPTIDWTAVHSQLDRLGA